MPMPEVSKLEDAIKSGDWNRARHLAALKVARMMDKTDSPREVKALSISLDDLIDKCEQQDVAERRRNSEAGRTLDAVRSVRK